MARINSQNVCVSCEFRRQIVSVTVSRKKARRGDLAKWQVNRHDNSRPGQGPICKVRKIKSIQQWVTAARPNTFLVAPKRLAFKPASRSERREERKPRVHPP